MFPRTLEIQAREGHRPGVRILRLAGAVTWETTEALLRAVAAEPAPLLILDFSSVTFLDTAGVGALIQIRTSFHQEGRKLALAGLSKQVRAVLQITRVLSLFEVFDSLAEAEQHFSASSPE